jgi:hypothetical protein
LGLQAISGLHCRVVTRRQILAEEVSGSAGKSTTLVRLLIFKKFVAITVALALIATKTLTRVFHLKTASFKTAASSQVLMVVQTSLPAVRDAAMTA